MLLNSVIALPVSSSGHLVTVAESGYIQQQVDNEGYKVHEAGESDGDGRIPKATRDKIIKNFKYRINEVGSSIDKYIDGTEEKTLQKKEPEDNVDRLIAVIENTGYLSEYAYIYHIDFLFNAVLMCITIVCLIFTGVKLAGLLFDIMFVQIIAPLIVASDLNGSGRAKKIVQNILSTYIIFIVVILLLRLYLIVMQGVRTSAYGDNFAVVIMLTIGGAKFVVDGPDLIVQILGIDAGVKSGLGIMMGLQTAMQVGSGISRGASGLVHGVANAPKRFSGFIGDKVAAGQQTAAAPGIGGKVKAAVGNSGVGQAFKQAYSGHSQTNEGYSQAVENALEPNIHPVADMGDSIGRMGGHIANSGSAVLNTVDSIMEVGNKPAKEVAKNAFNKGKRAVANEVRTFAGAARTGYSEVRKRPSVSSSGTPSENTGAVKADNQIAEPVIANSNETFAQEELRSESDVKTFADIQQEEEHNIPNIVSGSEISTADNFEEREISQPQEEKHISRGSAFGKAEPPKTDKNKKEGE